MGGGGGGVDVIKCFNSVGSQGVEAPCCDSIEKATTDFNGFSY